MKTGHKSLADKMSKATVEFPAEENMLDRLNKSPEERTQKNTNKQQANGKNPGAKHKSPAVAKSSKQKLKILVSEKATSLMPKPPVGKNVVNPTLALPADEKTSKPRAKFPVTKKFKKNPATAGHKTQKTNTGSKVNKVGKTNTSTDFVVRFVSKLTSLKDPDIKKVVDLLSKADDVKVHRKFFVSCKSKAAAKKLKSKLHDYNSNNGEKFHILPKRDPSVTSLTRRNKSHMLYVIGLTRNTTDEDLQNSFSKARSVLITKFWIGKKCVRIGHIRFSSSDDAKDALAVKNRRINGKYVQVTANKVAAMKRPLAQDVSSLPAKKAKLLMDKETEDDADDHDTMLSNDQEDSGEDEESHDSDVNEEEEEDDKSENEDENSNDEEVDLGSET